MSLIINPATLAPGGWWIADSATSGSIASWVDSSTQGYNLVQTASTAFQPICYPSIRNGHKALKFDGSNDYMNSSGTKTAAQFLGSSGTGTIMAVFAMDLQAPISAISALWSVFDTSGTTTRLGVLPSPGGVIPALVNTTPSVVAAKYSTGATGTVEANVPVPIDISRSYGTTQQQTWHVACWQYTSDSVRGAIDNLDTTAMVSQTVAVRSVSDFLRPIGIGFGGEARAGSTSPEIRFFKGWMSELIIFPDILTESQRQGVQLYLTNKYAMAYKSSIANEGAVTVSMTVEMMLDGVNWTDVTADVRVQDGLSMFYGMSGTEPEDRVAGAGSLTLSMDNSVKNSGGVRGYYSPGHAGVRAGFELACPVRVYFTHYGTKYYKWLGHITDIQPSLDPRDTTTKVVAMDHMDTLARGRLRLFSVSVNQTADWVMANIFTFASPLTPDSYIIGAGSDIYPYVFDSMEDERAIALSEIQRLALSEWGYAYVKGDDNGGGCFVFEPRNARVRPSSLSLSESNLHGLTVARSVDGIINRCLVTVHPRRADAGATTILYSLENNPQILAGETITFSAPYRDPDEMSVRVAGMNMQTPASTTDYQGNTISTGGGTSLTSGFTVGSDLGGNSADITVTNGTTQDGYLTFFQLRGQGLYSYEDTIVSAESTASQDSYGMQTKSIDMPYQDGIVLANSAAANIIAQYKDPRTRITGGYVKANFSSAAYMRVLATEIGDKVKLSNTVAGISSGEFYVQGIKLDVSAGPWLEASWSLIPATTNTY